MIKAAKIKAQEKLFLSYSKVLVVFIVKSCVISEGKRHIHIWLRNEILNSFIKYKIVGSYDNVEVIFIKTTCIHTRMYPFL